MAHELRGGSFREILSWNNAHFSFYEGGKEDVRHYAFISSKLDNFGKEKPFLYFYIRPLDSAFQVDSQSLSSSKDLDLKNLINDLELSKINSQINEGTDPMSGALNKVSFVPISEQAEKLGLKYFIHRTHIESIPAILKSDALVPGRLVKEKLKEHIGAPFGGYGHEKIFVEAVDPSRKGKKLFGSSSNFGWALFILNPTLIERSDYQASLGYKYGIQDISTVAPRHVPLLLNKLPGRANEFVFTESIPLKKYLIEIWVHPSMIEYVNQQMSKAQIELADFPDVKIKATDEYL